VDTENGGRNMATTDTINDKNVQQKESKLVRNAARCLKCGDVIESKHRHDFQKCRCGAIAVDGGLSYVRRLGWPEQMEELSEYRDE
jgi:hypothetical protein